MKTQDFIEAVEIAVTAAMEEKELKMAYWIGRATEIADHMTEAEENKLLNTHIWHYRHWVTLRSLCQQI